MSLPTRTYFQALLIKKESAYRHAQLSVLQLEQNHHPDSETYTEYLEEMSALEEDICHLRAELNC